jgi:hypothetical protein
MTCVVSEALAQVHVTTRISGSTMLFSAQCTASLLVLLLL